MRPALTVALVLAASTANAWEAGVPSEDDLAKAKAAIAEAVDGGYALVPSQMRHIGVLPPVEYDKPYPGKLTITRGSQFVMQQGCPKTTLPITLGCARHNETECWIIIATDPILRAAGLTYEIVLRHEVGHCGGWPNDHRGARPLDAKPALGPPPTLVKCLRSDGTEEPCELRAKPEPPPPPMEKIVETENAGHFGH
jgi:hypothetical protein